MTLTSPYEAAMTLVSRALVHKKPIIVVSATPPHCGCDARLFTMAGHCFADLAQREAAHRHRIACMRRCPNAFRYEGSMHSEGGVLATRRSNARRLTPPLTP